MLENKIEDKQVILKINTKENKKMNIFKIGIIQINKI